MSLNANYQKLEPGDEVRLLEIDGQAFGLDEVLYFHGYNVPHTAAEILAAGGDLDKLPAKSIWWQGREYKAWPCEIEGIESSTTGSDAQPTLRVGNIDGKISALCLHYDDLALARALKSPLFGLADEALVQIALAVKAARTDGGDAPAELCRRFCARTDFWGEDLNLLPGFADTVTENLNAIACLGARAALQAVLEKAEKK